MVLRYLMAVAVMAAVLRALGWSFRPPGALHGSLVRLALGNFGVALGYMTSILFIPVSLATVVFYTYPLMVMTVVPIIHNTRLGFRQFAAFGLAFSGLVLAFGPSLAVLDGRGVALALVAAVSAAYVFIVSPRVVGAYHAVGVSLYVNLAGVGLAGLFLAGSGGIQLPESAPGWAGLGGVGLFYVVGTLSMFLALHGAGSLRASLIFNLEPVVVICAAAVLLGERLAPLQMAGVALVIAALTLASLARAKA
jgi:drug/metabolite transporter (DMT)-like permease